MKKILTGTAIGLVSMTLAGGAFAGSHSVGACLITKTDTNPFFVKMREGAKAKAEELGIELKFYAGKSTLIKAISGAIQPDEGEILLDGKPTNFHTPQDARNAGIETVYQTLALSPALSIADNLFLGRELRKPGVMGSVFRKLDRARMEKEARDKMSELGLMTIQNILNC